MATTLPDHIKPCALLMRGSNWYAAVMLDGITWYYPLHAYGSSGRALEMANRSAAAHAKGHDQRQWMSRDRHGFDNIAWGVGA